MIKSPELYRNLKRVPEWDPLLPFEYQEKDAQQFWMEEAKKVKNGITINGVHISGWLYWHINFWKMYVDVKGKGRIPILSDLRDNEWFFAENYSRALSERKGLAMFGTRRGGKALLNDEHLYTRRGRIKIGKVEVGDYIYDADGVLVEVTNVFPQGKIPLYKVTFEDGREIVCCEEHIWRIRRPYSMNWTNHTLKSIMRMDFKKVSIPVVKPMGYKYEWDGSPSFMGSLCYQMLTCESSYMKIRKDVLESMLYTRREDKEEFIKAFVKAGQGIIKDHEEFPISVRREDIIDFVKKICWSAGYYCKEENNVFTISKTVDEVFIKDITYYGRYNATCITVKNYTGLFLTTNYLVTHNTSIESSVLGMNATMTRGLDHMVVGFSDSDLGFIGQYTEFGLDNVPPFFRINRMSNDWSKGVVLGTKTTDNIRNVHAHITITNINMGKKQSTQKGAGSTPHTVIIDEIGKGAIKKPYKAIAPAMDTAEGWRGTFLMAGTGGEVDMSKDAQEILSNPGAYNLVTNDWSLLGIGMKEKKTWKERKWCVFMPGQMSLSRYAGEKKDIPLGIYLGKPEAKDLNKIIIKATDFDGATKRLKEHFDSLVKTDRVAYAMDRMYYPLDIDDCFMKTGVNPFPVEAAMKHKTELLSGPRPGKTVEVYSMSGGKLGTKFSDKQIAEYPFAGGVIDAPVIIFEDPVNNNYGDFIYAAGLDPYKKDSSTETSSLGSMYIFKRMVGINDPYANRIVACVATRPPGIDDFSKTCEILQDGYGAYCLMENADLVYKQYLTRKGRDGILFDGDPIVDKYIKAGSTQNTQKGLTPSPRNQTFLFKLVVSYCWEKILVDIDDEGREQYIYGVERIDDIGLLDEIIDYHPGGNYDRLVSFGHALALAKYYDDMNFMPKGNTEKINEEKRKSIQKAKESRRKFVRFNPYRS